MPPRPRLDVVVPTLDEADHLPLLLADLAALPLPHGVIVSDGGSTDGTRRLAGERGATVLTGPTGRARQLNAGARASDADWLLFLHADSRLPGDSAATFVCWLRGCRPDEAAVFRFALDGEGRFWRFLELGQRLRERLYGLPYGDQGLAVSRVAFEAVGGYPDLPVMEDVEIIRRLRSRGSLTSLPAPLLTSPRRYEEEGRWSGWLRNTALIGLHLAGVPAQSLARWYGPRRPGGAGTPGAPDGGLSDCPPRAGRVGASSGRGRILLVFVKLPVAGRVKTRLGRDVGPERAARIYRGMAEGVVGRLAGGPWRTVVCFDPAGAKERVRRWLGDAPEYRPQRGEDLGARMEEALEWALREADAACVVGTDVPGLDRETVEAAFRTLSGSDVVLGPAADGGYYLVGLARLHGGLFRGIPWSTPAVLETTLDRAAALGLRTTRLPVLRDVDTLDDLERIGPAST